MSRALFAAVLVTGSLAHAAPTPPAFRLPGDVKPKSYALELTVVPDLDKAPGRVKIDATVVRPTRVVWLNATDLAVTSATLAGAKARVVPGNADFVGLTLDRDLPAGPLAIDVSFTAGIDHDKSRGIYAVDEGGTKYAYTFFESTDARRAFPCFDEPAYKVPWQLTLHAKTDQVALANAPVVKDTPEAGGMHRVELATTRPLPSYLVAFVVGPFEVIDDGVAGRAKTPIRFIVPKGRAGELGYAKEITPKVVAALEDYFDMDYPYGKLDVAVVPRYWGTMEHPGIVAMGQTLTLIRPDQATRSRKQAYANILAHELSHYWFGDVVTLAWWDDTWLNESLGEWMDMIITSAVEPTWRLRDDRVDYATSAMVSDETTTIRAIRQPVTSPEGIQAAFDADITYFKGASITRMFEAWVKPEKWRDFIRAYIRAHQWGNATADDFLGAVKASFGAPVELGMRSFLEQPGVPRIAVAPVCEKGKPVVLAVKQQRALPASAKDPVAHTWTLPVCVRYGTATTSAETCRILDKAEDTFPIEGGCPTWLLANARADGYYRSVVDAKIARSLLDAKSPIGAQAKLSAPERTMLVADLRAAVSRKEIPITDVLALVPRVVADPDPKVARSAFDAASFAAGGLDEAMFQKARAFYLRAFGPVARRLTWSRRPTDSDETHQLRRSVLGTAAHDDPALGAQADKLVARWLKDRIGLDDELVPVALQAATARGGQKLFDQLLEATRHPRDRGEQQRLLQALGSFRDRKVAEQALALVLTKEFDLRDSGGIVLIVLGTHETRDLGLAFVTAHIDELLGRLRGDEGSWFLGAIAGSFCDRGRVDAVKALVVPRAEKVEGAKASVTRGLELSEQCIAEIQDELPALKKFLQ